jgi:aryl-alcohol dehydrogenase-like predicted oxidoreductase
VLATKFHGQMGDGPNRAGGSRRWIVAEVEKSLRRLQVDHIDLYQLHHPDPETDIEETLSALTDLMHDGKVRAIGASNFPAADIVEAQWVAERRGLARFRSEQPPSSILNRGIEREVLPACQRYGMGVLVWSPLSFGMLAGRYRKGQPQSPRNNMAWVLDRIDEIAPPRSDIGLLDIRYQPPAVTSASLRRRIPMMA